MIIALFVNAVHDLIVVVVGDASLGVDCVVGPVVDGIVSVVHVAGVDGWQIPCREDKCEESGCDEAL